MSHRSEGTAALKADRHYTYRDYRTWPEDERWELIAGSADAMSPAPRREHQGLVTKLSAQVSAFTSAGGCKSYVSPIDVFLPTADEDLDDIDLVLQPDIVIVCDPAKLIPEGIRGAPDLVIEVMSPGTAMRDQTEKRTLYEAYGVKEYWIANPTTLEVLVYCATPKDTGDPAYGLPVPGSLIAGVASRVFDGLVLQAAPEDL